MSRQVVKRYRITSTLVADSAIHVGAAEEGLATDMLVAIDGMGRAYLPGPSLAGAIRADLRARGVEAAALWGADRTDDASRVVIDDAPAHGQPEIEIRDGVAISRRTGTAAAGKLYTRQVLPAGTKFDFTAEVDQVGSGEATEVEARELADRIGRVCKEGFQVGAFAGKGLGRLKASKDGGVRIAVTDFGTRKGMVTAMLGGACGVGVGTTVLPPRLAEVRIEMPWRARGPVLVSRSVEGGSVDTAPLVARRPAGPTLLLPGSSIKGAMRAQAERITATMGAPQVATQAVRDLFGNPGDRTAPPSAGEVTPAARNTGWRGILRVSDVIGPVVSAETERGDPSKRLKVGDHVAIDRWTGGAKDTALFSVLEPWATKPGDWGPIVLAVELGRIPGPRREPALGLLVLVLRDLAQGWFGLGFGTARGYGAVEVDTQTCQFTGLPDGEKTLAELVGAAPAAARWVAQLWAEKLQVADEGAVV